MAKLAVLVAFLAVVSAGISIMNANPTGRIVGGYDANPNQFPHQISLRKYHNHKCGGSIVSRNFVLTAAHCVVENGTTPSDAKLFTIRAGSHNRIAGGSLIQVKRIVVNENYNGFTNDSALLELEENLVFSAALQPIQLATEEVPVGEEVIISGWGLPTTFAANLPIILQWDKVTSMSKAKCASKIGVYSDSLICLDHPKDAGACSGDSGGPATYQGKLIGVCNFVAILCGTSRPDGYTKVSYYIEWIRDNMK